MPVRFYGPGDVTGIDAREIVRTEPRHQTTDFEPNYFAAIEFDDPSFPWMFTPAAADAQGRLRPWLCLVVVPRDASELEPVSAGRPLPALVCALGQLPDLRDSWAWAHVQLTRNPAPAANQSVRQVLEGYPDRTISRLLGARRLDAGVAYRVCVVPAFASGRKAGLGIPLATADEQSLQPAWPYSAADASEAPSSDGGARVRLPVYYSWDFSTGAAGDFETLVRRLKRPGAPLGLQPPRVDVSRPGWTVPPLTFGPEPLILDLPGALRAPGGSTADGWQGDARYTFEEHLRMLLNAPQQAAQGSGSGVPIVGPPLYGQEQARQFSLPPDQTEPQWLREVNLDPRLRAAAGLGALAVRGEQEALVASAWQQLAEHVERDQQELRRQQLGAEVADALNAKHLAPLPAVELALIAAPALRAAVAPSGAASGAAEASETSALLATMPAAQALVSPLLGAPMLDPAHRRMARAFRRATPAVNSLERWLSSAPMAGQDVRVSDASHASLTAAVEPEFVMTPPPAPRELISTTRVDLLRQLTATTAAPEDEPPPFAPRFTRPAYELLRDYFPDLVLPGMSGVPANTVAVLQTNPSFIEAFMVGLNHEIVRELVWRGFPIARRATLFQRFWTSQDPNAAEVPPIDGWSGSSHIGDHFGAGRPTGVLVLLIRGDLLHRYPRTTISAVEARWSADRTRRELGTDERQPLFRASWGLDVTLLGFPLTEPEARGSTQSTQHPGWFFLIQEQATEPRFGLDAPTSVTSRPPATWDDLAWGHLAPTAQDVMNITYVPLAGPLQGATSGGLTWGRNSAHMAGITLQRAFRVAIHASAWLPQA
jgi:hypothetical protein